MGGSGRDGWRASSDELERARRASFNELEAGTAGDDERETSAAGKARRETDGGDGRGGNSNEI